MRLHQSIMRSPWISKPAPSVIGAILWFITLFHLLDSERNKVSLSRNHLIRLSEWGDAGEYTPGFICTPPWALRLRAKCGSPLPELTILAVWLVRYASSPNCPPVSFAALSITISKRLQQLGVWARYITDDNELGQMNETAVFLRFIIPTYHPYIIFISVAYTIPILTR